MKHLAWVIHMLTFWAFIAVKVGGTSLATWSWWWLLMPGVPSIFLALSKGGWL